MRVYIGCYKSRLGWLSITATDDTLLTIRFSKSRKGSRQATKTPLLTETYRQLDAYFSGKRKKLTLPFAMLGTKFQKRVWNILPEIPYGDVVTYGEIAKAIGKPRAFRAVGTALSKNKLPILLPCHRVVKSDLRLGGFTGGLHLKRQLLELEGVLESK